MSSRCSCLTDQHFICTHPRVELFFMGGWGGVNLHDLDRAETSRTAIGTIKPLFKKESN